MKKADWVCPHCKTTLRKDIRSDGEHVKRCPNCRAVWFVICCRLPDPPTFGQVELFKKPA